MAHRERKIELNCIVLKHIFNMTNSYLMISDSDNKAKQTKHALEKFRNEISAQQVQVFQAYLENG